MARYWRRGFLVMFLVGAAGLWCAPAWADHSLGRACLSCHSLRSANVLSGSRNIACSNINDPLYGYNATCGDNALTYWYCPSIDSTSQWAPTSDQPLDCSYCHDSAGDIGDEIGRGTITTASPASAHPVDVRGTGDNIGSIRCNDCHNAEVNPNAPCDKTGPEDGYPNHLNLVDSTPPGLDTGTNARIGAAAHLVGEYGPTAGETWGDGTAGGPVDGDISTVLCFSCHSSSGMAATDILLEYDAPHGGHNILNPDDGADVRYGDLNDSKLPCYDCHDPHASSQNERLIIGSEDTPRNPYDTSYSGYVSPDAFAATNDDYKVCVTCHDGGRTVEGAVIDDVVGVTTIASLFPFHSDAHDDVTATSNCLQTYGGCHQSAHNTDIFRCLDCHSKAVTDLIPSAPARLVAVHNLDSEFGHIGSVGVASSAPANEIQSVHTIPYAATVWLPGQSFTAADAALDMSDPANNGCLYCHDTRYAANRTLPILKDADDNFYTGSREFAFTGGTDPRNSLSHFDPFCLSCHDDDTAANRTTFTLGSSYDLSDASEPNGSALTYRAGELFPPQVDNKAAPAADGYFYAAGHGRGLGTPSGGYSSGLASPTTENNAAEVPCLECHLYHGSTAYKLLPGWRESSDGVARVVKGQGYPLKPSGKPATGIANSIGGLGYSSAIDYTDYSSPVYARAESDYQNNDSWSSYGHGNTPDGEPTPFGTSGNVFDLSCTTSWDADNLTGYDANGSKEIGFCNACHLSDVSNDGTTTAYDAAFTHEGSTTAVDCDGTDWGSRRDFARDCLDCHDPHGSGTDSTTGTPNIFMMRQRVKNSASPWTNVLFTSRTGANSFDEDDLSNGDDLCNACHVTLDHSNNNPAPNSTNEHAMGVQCTATCHTHED